MIRTLLLSALMISGAAIAWTLQAQEASTGVEGFITRFDGPSSEPVT